MRTPKVLVVIDQAEELVTRTGPRDQQRFLGLRGALSETSPLWAVATLRSEFLTTAPERAGLAEALDGAVVVEPFPNPPLVRQEYWVAQPPTPHPSAVLQAVSQNGSSP